MPQELHITLTEEQSEAIQAAIASGEYSSPEEVITATLEDWKWQREWLTGARPAASGTLA